MFVLCGLNREVPTGACLCDLGWFSLSHSIVKSMYCKGYIYRHKCSCINYGVIVFLHSKTKGFEKEEKLVYQIIEDSTNKGIWIRDIRYKSNLPNKQISKVLKTLESKKLIKSVKSISAARRRVYMLYDLSPDESLTGGAWYSNDQEFETEFVDILNTKCHQYLQQKVSKWFVFSKASILLIDYWVPKVV